MRRSMRLGLAGIVTAMSLMLPGARLTAQSAADSVAADSTAADKVDRSKALDQLLKAHSYGVPRSPAFALLTETPGKVLHMGAGADLQQAAQTFVNGGKVATGVALDWRPLGGFAGSLTRYQNSPARRIAWRSVLAVGTAPSGDDVLLSAGLRIPLIDRGDVRANPNAIDRMEQAYRDELARKQPPLGATTDDLRARFEAASDSADVARKAIAQQLWNRFKLDVGVAGAIALADGRWQDRDAHSAGIWIGAAVPLGSRAQLTGMAKNLWMDGDTVGAPTRETTSGARLSWFPYTWLTLSGEGTGVWGEFKEIEGMDPPSNDTRWFSVAFFAEVELPWNAGWFGIGYGGDLKRSDQDANRLTFQYARYSERKLSR